MVWGARLLSPTGLFADENATAPNERPISRHIVFMTDGEMAPNVPNLTSQGYEYLMQRVSGSFDTSNGELEDRLNNRFGQLCRSEEHTSELQSLMRISYAVFCLKKKNTHNT